MLQILDTRMGFPSPSLNVVIDYFSHSCLKIVMGDRLNFIINHQLESVDAFDAILQIIIGSHIFTELSTFYAPEGNSGASGFYPLSMCKG